ncbi:Corepressor interacting with RBPJ 1 [Brachionus plicatilis]|uniref:Corepressor interacting with RBPJ 1 n=1 Tax=Brachionus plicatilis TaxID=10195 RepID=A0A3M7S0U4_BRAPC|nr:Corepressor interacting with RBPJ 1 [Brachionus plicatilis]
MGKGFENYMSKKWFHPTNVENQKRKYLAEQKSAADKKRQQDLRDQYEREQEIFSNKELMGDEKAKLGLAFMYQAPGSLKDNQDKERVEEPVQVEISSSKRTRPDSANLRCLKCKRLGHLNTDKVCPLYGKSRLDVDDDEIVPEIPEAPKVEIKSEPKEHISESKENMPVVESNPMEITLDMLRTLPKKEKKVLLKRLKKLDKKLKRKSN